MIVMIIFSASSRTPHDLARFHSVSAQEGCRLSLMLTPASAKSIDSRDQSSPSLDNFEQLDIENQFRVRRDIGRATHRAVPEIGRNDQFPLAPDLHGCHAFEPTLDHAAGE